MEVVIVVVGSISRIGSSSRSRRSSSSSSSSSSISGISSSSSSSSSCCCCCFGAPSLFWGNAFFLKNKKTPPFPLCDLVTSHVCVETEMEAKAEESAGERGERKQARERERERERDVERGIERERGSELKSLPPHPRSVFSVQRTCACASPPLMTMGRVSEVSSWLDVGGSSRVLT